MSPSRGTRTRRAKLSPHIAIEPNYLVFPPPHHGRCIQNVLCISNTSSLPCVYKVRSGNPERYMVKPRLALISPTSATRIRVTLRDLGSAENNAPADYRERFRITVKFVKPRGKTDAEWHTKVNVRQVWEQCGDDVAHEVDLLAHFRPDMPAPMGGMVSFLPANAVPPTPSTTTRQEKDGSENTSPSASPGAEGAGKSKSSSAATAKGETTTSPMPHSPDGSATKGRTQRCLTAELNREASSPRDGSWVIRTMWVLAYVVLMVSVVVALLLGAYALGMQERKGGSEAQAVSTTQPETPLSACEACVAFVKEVWADMAHSVVTTWNALLVGGGGGQLVDDGAARSP